MPRELLTDADLEKFTANHGPYPEPGTASFSGGPQVLLDPVGMENRRKKVVLPVGHWAQIQRIAAAAKIPFHLDLSEAEARRLAVVLGEFLGSVEKVIQLCSEVPGILVRY